MIHSSEPYLRLVRRDRTGWCDGYGEKANYEGLGIYDQASAYAVANFTAAPAILRINGLTDYYSWRANLSFTQGNQVAFAQNTEKMLPFIMLTHDYFLETPSDYSNTFGTLADQENAFFNWLGGQSVSPL